MSCCHQWRKKKLQPPMEGGRSVWAAGRTPPPGEHSRESEWWLLKGVEEKWLLKGERNGIRGQLGLGFEGRR